MGLPSLLEKASEDILDAVNLSRHIPRRKPGDFANLHSVEAFQVRQDHVAIERFQPLDHLQQSVERQCAVSRGLAACGSGKLSNSSNPTSASVRLRYCRATWVAPTLCATR